MELVVAPIAELRSRITHLFEEVVAATLEQASAPPINHSASRAD